MFFFFLIRLKVFNREIRETRLLKEKFKGGGRTLEIRLGQPESGARTWPRLPSRAGRRLLHRHLLGACSPGGRENPAGAEPKVLGLRVVLPRRRDSA